MADAKLVEGFVIDGYPAYFLVDRVGKVVAKSSHSLPTEDEVKSLLKK